MKKRIVTSVLVGSLVFTPLAGVSTVWADGISYTDGAELSGG